MLRSACRGAGPAKGSHGLRHCCILHRFADNTCGQLIRAADDALLEAARSHQQGSFSIGPIGGKKRDLAETPGGGERCCAPEGRRREVGSLQESDPCTARQATTPACQDYDEPIVTDTAAGTVRPLDPPAVAASGIAMSSHIAAANPARGRGEGTTDDDSGKEGARAQNPDSSSVGYGDSSGWYLTSSAGERSEPGQRANSGLDPFWSTGCTVLHTMSCVIASNTPVSSNFEERW